MASEMKSLHLNGVWELVELPSSRKIVGSKWVSKWKVHANGIVEQHKARLVAEDCMQRFDNWDFCTELMF